LQGALLLVLFQTSHSLEHLLTAKAQGNLAALYDAMPKEATLVATAADGSPDVTTARRVLAADVAVGDCMLVKPGEQVRLWIVRLQHRHTLLGQGRGSQHATVAAAGHDACSAQLEPPWPQRENMVEPAESCLPHVTKLEPGPCLCTSLSFITCTFVFSIARAGLGCCPQHSLHGLAWLGKLASSMPPQVPLDGAVLHGRAMVSSEHITGESLPVLRRAGDEVAAGSLNRDGLLVLRALRPAEDSTPARIARLTLDAQVGSQTGQLQVTNENWNPSSAARAVHARLDVCEARSLESRGQPSFPPHHRMHTTATSPLCPASSFCLPVHHTCLFQSPLPYHRRSGRSCAAGWTALGRCTARA
jgi:hypothetical protein